MPAYPLPQDLYAPARKNSAGVEFGDRASLDALLPSVGKAAPRDAQAAALIDGMARKGTSRAVVSPIDGSTVGHVAEADGAIAADALAAAARGFAAWAERPVEERAAALERVADLLEQNRAALIALLQREGGKTLDDALAEVREAVDFCRYYAAEARAFACAASRCPGRPARRTSCTIAGAACSSASGRGISRWRSSSGRSPRRWSRAMPSSPSRPSRRR